MSPRKTLEDIVFENGLTDILRLERAKRESTARNVSLAATLIDLGYVNQRALAGQVALSTGFPLVDPLPEKDVVRLQSRLPAAIAREAMAVPVSLAGETLTVAMLDPTLESVVETLALTSGLKIVPAVAVRGPLETLVDRIYPESQGDDITLMAGLRLSLDDGKRTEESSIAGQPEERGAGFTVANRADDFGTVVMRTEEGDDSEGGDTTAPRGSGQLRPLELRVDTLESRLVDIVRILADVQARLDAIEARLRRLPNS